MPVEQLVNPKGAFGYTANVHGGRVVEVFEADGTIAALDVCFLGADGKVTQAATSDEPKLCVGIALEGASAGDTVQVITRGVVQDVPKEAGDDSIAAGTHLQRSATTAGVLATLTPAAVADRGDGVAIAIEASNDTNDTVSVYVVGINGG